MKTDDSHHRSDPWNTTLELSCAGKRIKHQLYRLSITPTLSSLNTKSASLCKSRHYTWQASHRPEWICCFLLVFRVCRWCWGPQQCEGGGGSRWRGKALKDTLSRTMSKRFSFPVAYGVWCVYVPNCIGCCHIRQDDNMSALVYTLIATADHWSSPKLVFLIRPPISAVISYWHGDLIVSSTPPIPTSCSWEQQGQVQMDTKTLPPTQLQD